jgi:hypothetical protein
MNVARLLSVAVAIGLLACVAPARAGTYTVLSCKDRAGALAPLNDASGGWIPGNSGGPGLDSPNYCADPSLGFEAAVGGIWSHPVGSQAWWRFVAPRATLVEGDDILYSGATRPFNGQNRGIIYFSAPQAGFLETHFGDGSIAAGWMTRRNLHETSLQATAQCDGATGSAACDGGPVASIDLLRSEIVLSDTSPPTAGPATGSAVASPVWRDTVMFAFPASDEGGGVYQAILDVDGTPRLTQTIDDWGGRCVDTTAGQRVFRFPRPCLGSVDALVAIDANALPPGDRDVTLRVSDSAGNLRTVYSARKAIVVPARQIGPGSDPALRGTTNGDNASDSARLAARWDRTARATLTAPYGRRSVIRGRLTDASGTGIRNARIELLATIDGRSGTPHDKGGARTRGDGRFTLVLPRNASSRTLLLRYRSHVNDTVSVAQRTLRLKVRAGIRLAVTPHVAARGRSVRLRGRLVGSPLPRGGKVVELQARSPGQAWITFRTIRASRTGRFASRYTFRRGGPALYEMRVRVRAADDYPYATGVSRVVRVRVR